MERFRPNTENPELGWETEVIFDDVVKRELDHHKELNSRRKKLIFIQDTFQFWNPVELGNILRVDEKTIRRFLSRRGIRNEEYQEVQKQFEGVFAITSIIESHVSGLLPRRDALIRPNALLQDSGAKQMLKLGEVEKAVAVAERTFKFIHDRS
jgi:hypothetical protein